MRVSIEPERSRRWSDYLLAGLFVAPSLAAFWLMLVFVTPKLKQMCADAGFEGRAFFQPMDWFAEWGWLAAGIGLALACAAESGVAAFRKHRRALLGGVVLLLNSAVLAALVSSLFLTAMVGPALGAKVNQTASVRP